MNIGVVNRALAFGLLALTMVACGSSSDDKPAANCGTAQKPMDLEIKDVSPAVDASVANAGIVQTFTLVGQHLQLDSSSVFVLPVAHTAGQTVPSPGQWSIALNGADTVYTSAPFSWEHAPAHVEIDSNGLIQTDAGCILALPKQIFRYDVTAP